ncbi:integrin-linked kinase-associated serine/threonine phosphatase 2C-like [Patiria miniata]|uniref:Integrin-linked kinase-associated serine/threonine phosphatase 2C n=1 Tax=Patiria miniata TaxID=46514 RepID=A0A914BIX3_PATMI|nr:integrin-linked kinase-associated serine/threonine phosphatase 2C-like [Patiria miniata]XP_038075855.1 integrin-linked kinase-associated serine/threonine phosphatase 2C-like [Patiria miniata]XP_038075857.1 integrin-linked kinase-associated serine/threonine phosphatase 2C-like [Patiria miniata]
MDTSSQEHEEGWTAAAVNLPTEEAIFDNKTIKDGGKRKMEERTTKDEPQLKRRVSLDSGFYRLQSFSAERKGEREDMQDACTLLDDCTDSITTLPPTVSRIAYFAVFDGHSGARASRHAAQALHGNLFSKFPKTETGHSDKEIKRCLIDTFKLTDEAFLKQASAQKPVWKDGSTAVCVVAVNNVLYIANLGDSKAMLCRFNEQTQKLSLIPLSKEHNPTMYEERMRIQKAGGTVQDGRVQGILEVSRSIGDGRFKHCGVSCVPDIKKCQLTDSDRYLLLACDGLWKGFNAETALQFIQKILQDKTIKSLPGKTLDETRFDLACNKLASEAIRRGSSDNVTVVLVSISKT